VAAARRRDVSDAPAAELLEQLLKLGRLGADLGHGSTGRAGAGRVQVESQEPPGPGAGIVDRHRARLTGRISRQRPGMPVGFQNSGIGPDLGFYAARSYSLMRPPRTGQRLTRLRERSATG
jgi:hypothetical protein